MKPLDPELMGDIFPCLILWRGTYPSWLSPPHSDPGSTQIPTRHFSAQSQTAIQLTSLETMPTSKSPEDGVGANFAPHFDNPDGTVGLL
jgi:hypothetical protein